MCCAVLCRVLVSCQALHFIQIIHSGRFQLFDYGSTAENMGENALQRVMNTLLFAVHSSVPSCCIYLIVGSKAKGSPCDSLRLSILTRFLCCSAPRMFPLVWFDHSAAQSAGDL